MSMIPIKAKKYDDGRTKQSFKDETDINKILSRAQKTGTISHLAKHQAVYGDFAEFDFLQAQLNLTRGREIFDELPSELRREFNQSPAEFFEFVNKPENADRLGEILPELAQPGRQRIDVSGKIAPETPSGVASERQASETPPTAEKPVPPGDQPVPAK